MHTEDTEAGHLPHGSSISEILDHQAAARPDHEFLCCGNQSLSFRQTAERVECIAADLHGSGLAAGSHVALMTPNCVEFVLYWMACARLGIVSIFVNPAYSGYMLDYILDDARPAGLVVHADVAGQLCSARPDMLNRVKWLCMLGGEAPLPAGYTGAVLGPQTLCAASALPAAEPAHPGAPNCVIYTSGTTGPSKGVVLSNAALLAGAATFVELAEMGGDDILYTPLPLFHGLASRQGVLGCLLAGAKVVIGARFSASQFWEQVCLSQATIAQTMFNIPAMLKAQPRHRLERQHKLRVMYNANYDQAFEDRYGVPLLEAYGLVETGITLYTPASRRVPGSCGRLHHDWEAMIVDAQGQEVPDGVAGELLLRPRKPALFMEGYLNKPDATLRACRDFWFHTGDFLYRDRNGYFFFAGREKERIRRRGENISAWEIERIVSQHPAVELCAAMGYPAPVGDDDIRLALTLKPGARLTPTELSHWLAAHMPFHMSPRYIEIVDALPLTPTKKVRKAELMEQGLSPGAWDRDESGGPAHGTSRNRAV